MKVMASRPRAYKSNHSGNPGGKAATTSQERSPLLYDTSVERKKARVSALDKIEKGRQSKQAGETTTQQAGETTTQQARGTTQQAGETTQQAGDTASAEETSGSQKNLSLTNRKLAREQAKRELIDEGVDTSGLNQWKINKRVKDNQQAALFEQKFNEFCAKNNGKEPGFFKKMLIKGQIKRGGGASEVDFASRMGIDPNSTPGKAINALGNKSVHIGFAALAAVLAF